MTREEASQKRQHHLTQHSWLENNMNEGKKERRRARTLVKENERNRDCVMTLEKRSERRPFDYSLFFLHHI
jgi:hypothetical protein